MNCACPENPARTVTDPARHEAWHALVVAQGGPAGLVNAATLRELRGMTGGVGASRTVVDVRAELSGKRVPGWRRRASHG
jgi:hypothetical protein